MPHFHLPLQSGCDKTLQRMRRRYNVNLFAQKVGLIIQLIPHACIAADVIVGFPGETEKDFQESVKVFQKVKYNEAYINKYSPRPGTAAYCLGDPIDQEEKKRREKFLRKMI